jgi:sugar phosphate isomerase/epimerase
VRLGVCTRCLKDEPLPEVLRWAGEAGFETVEVPCVLGRGDSWHEGPALRVAALDGRARDALGTALEGAGLSASALAPDGDLMDADPGRAKTALDHLGRTIEAAATLAVPVVCLEVGRDPARDLGDSIAEFVRRVRPAVEQAEAAKVRLAVGNDPRPGRYAEDAPGGALFAPELWEKLFTHLRSESVGLALDPAHLVWLGIDPIGALTDYLEKVFHVRARDVEVFDQRRQDCSVLRPSGGWWRYRLPGLGVIDWRRLLDRLYELAYDGAVAIDHDDPVWQGTPQKVKTGLALARRLVAQFMP